MPPDDRTVDLQTHSTFSYGTFAPTAIVEKAAAIDLAAVALTDHDTVAGQAEMIAAGETHGVEVVPGVEISVLTPYQGIDLLGYFIDPEDAGLVALLDEVRSFRDERTPQILAKLADVGVDITMDDVRAQAEGDVLGRPHVARAVVAAGHAKDVDDAFDRYLGLGKPAYVAKERLAAPDGIERIHAAGGLAVLAHPCYVFPGHFPMLLDELVEAGLDGLEVWYAQHDATAVDHFGKVAEAKGLVATGGSDFHGEHKPDIQLGRGLGDLRVPYSVVDELRARLG